MEKAEKNRRIAPALINKIINVQNINPAFFRELLRSINIIHIQIAGI